MIKRRFYRLEHVDKDKASDSSSSSSEDSVREAEESTEDEEVEVEAKENDGSHSISSGYESEDSSANEIDVDSSGLPSNEDDEAGKERQILSKTQLSGDINTGIVETQSTTASEKESWPEDFPDCILKCKSTFKCRICPRIVCLNEESLRAHLNSKRHARSEKLLNEGRLKSLLNSDGEVENQETPAELHARVVAPAQDNPKRKNRGRQRQKKRLKKKKVEPDLSSQKTKKSTEKPAKKRHKNGN